MSNETKDIVLTPVPVEPAPSIEGAGPSGTVYVGPLDTLARVREELARLYRDARRAAGRRPDAMTAARLGTLLVSIGRVLEGSEIERRIEELEREMGKQK